MQVEPGGLARSLQRVPLGDRGVSEDALQDLLDQHPELLPARDIDPALGPLISLGREIVTSVGQIDNLFVTPSGQLVVVEAKLWKNPEARREVVGQIIDYASALSMLTVDELDGLVAQSDDSRRGIWARALTSPFSSQVPEESSFRDALRRNLKQGRFLLLVVGDSIRDEVERMAQFLHSTPQLQFTLALVELQLWRLEGDNLVVVPSIVASTVEVTRAVVEVTSGPEGDIAVSVTTPTDEPRRRHNRASFVAALNRNLGDPDLADYASELLGDFEVHPPWMVDWAKTSVGLKLGFPGRAQRLSVLHLSDTGELWTLHLEPQLDSLGVPSSLGLNLVADLAAVFGVHPDQAVPFAWDDYVPLSKFREHEERTRAVLDAFLESVQEALAQEP